MTLFVQFISIEYIPIENSGPGRVYNMQLGQKHQTFFIHFWHTVEVTFLTMFKAHHPSYIYSTYLYIWMNIYFDACFVPRCHGGSGPAPVRLCSPPRSFKSLLRSQSGVQPDLGWARRHRGEPWVPLVPSGAKLEFHPKISPWESCECFINWSQSEF